MKRQRSLESTTLTIMGWFFLTELSVIHVPFQEYPLTLKPRYANMWFDSSPYKTNKKKLQKFYS